MTTSLEAQMLLLELSRMDLIDFCWRSICFQLAELLLIHQMCNIDFGATWVLPKESKCAIWWSLHVRRMRFEFSGVEWSTDIKSVAARVSLSALLACKPFWDFTKRSASPECSSDAEATNATSAMIEIMPATIPIRDTLCPTENLLSASPHSTFIWRNK